LFQKKKKTRKSSLAWQLKNKNFEKRSSGKDISQKKKKQPWTAPCIPKVRTSSQQGRGLPIETIRAGRERWGVAGIHNGVRGWLIECPTAFTKNGAQEGGRAQGEPQGTPGREKVTLRSYSPQHMSLHQFSEYGTKKLLVNSTEANDDMAS